MIGQENNPIVNESQFNSLNLKSNDIVWVKCPNCGKVVKKKFNNKSLLCRTCKGIETKRKQGNLKCSKKTKEKIRQAALSKEVKDKRRKTNLERYGVEETFSSKEVREKINKTNLERYNGCPLSNKDVRKKIEKTNLEKFGTKVAACSEEVRNKISEANSLDSSKKKRISTCVEKYGCEYVTQNKEIRDNSKKRYTYDEIDFDSSWELAFYIYCVNNEIDISKNCDKFEYTFNDEKHFYFPDFKIDNKYIEIKGPQFFKNGKLINPYDRSQDALYESKQKCMIEHNVEIITKDKITKYLNYVNEKFTKDYIPLFRNDLDFPFYDSFSLTDRMSIIRYFHKSIFYANKENKLSPFDAWKDKSLIKESALNRLKYVKKCTPKDVLGGFSVAHIAPKVSVFSPILAESLIEKYLKDFDEVFDPFSGFSGRMLGCKNKRYIGQDINELHVKESNEIIKLLNINAEVKVEDSCKSTGEYECLFTCPPYNLKERWNENEMNKSCDEWIDICLKNYKCKKYLFVVDNTEKYKNFIVEEIKNKSHFETNYEKVILI